MGNKGTSGIWRGSGLRVCGIAVWIIVVPLEQGKGREKEATIQLGMVNLCNYTGNRNFWDAGLDAMAALGAG